MNVKNPVEILIETIGSEYEAKIKELKAENALLRAEAKIDSPHTTGNPYEKELHEIYKSRLRELDSKQAVIDLSYKRIKELEAQVAVARGALGSYSKLTPGRWGGPDDIYEDLHDTAVEALTQLDRKPVAVKNVTCHKGGERWFAREVNNDEWPHVDSNLRGTLIVHGEEDK